MKRAAILLSLVLIGAPSIAQRRLSLEDAIRLGVTNSHPVRIAEAKAAGAEARASETRTALLPSVRLEGGYRRLSDVDPFQVQLPFMTTPVVISPVVLDNWTSRVGVQQPLFTGFRLSANADASARLAEAAREERTNEREDAVLTTMSAYWALYQAREVRRSVEENVKRLERMVADGEQMLRAGMLAQGDYLRIQVQLSSARIMALDADTDVKLAEMNCNSIMGLPLDTSLELASNPEDVPESGPAAAAARTPAGGDSLLRRADLRSSVARVEAARAGVMAAQGNWWPQIALSGNYYYSKPNSRYLPTREEWKGTWDVGVVLSYDLWNWGATARQSEQAQAALRLSEEAHAQMQDRASLEIARASSLQKRSVERTAMAALAVEQARESHRTTRERFTAGAATPGDLLDAEVALLQAETALVGARIERALSAARLAKASGILRMPGPDRTN